MTTPAEQNGTSSEPSAANARPTYNERFDEQKFTLAELDEEEQNVDRLRRLASRAERT
jgi:hypothetical protein